jgi:hypothetical protein
MACYNKIDTTNFEPTLFRTSILESGEPETGAYWSDVSIRSRIKCVIFVTNHNRSAKLPLNRDLLILLYETITKILSIFAAVPRLLIDKEEGRNHMQLRAREPPQQRTSSKRHKVAKTASDLNLIDLHLEPVNPADNDGCTCEDVRMVTTSEPL